MSAGPAVSPALDDLLEELDALPSQQPALTRVLQLVNDDECSANMLGGAVSCDPALTTKLLRLANSAFYGMSGRIGTPSRAVTVVGFTTVGALAASAATGLDGRGATPAGYWKRAACLAVAASLLAKTVGADQPQAFCAGLLADLGGALLHQVESEAYEAAVDEAVAERLELIRVERDRFGWAHDELGARVLEAWRFPPPLCAAIAGHHRAVAPSAEPLTRAVRAAMIVLSQIPGLAPHPCAEAAIIDVTRGRLSPDALPALASRVEEAGTDLALALSG